LITPHVLTIAKISFQTYPSRGGPAAERTWTLANDRAEPMHLVSK